MARSLVSVRTRASSRAHAHAQGKVPVQPRCCARCVCPPICQTQSIGAGRAARVGGHPRTRPLSSAPPHQTGSRDGCAASLRFTRRRERDGGRLLARGARVPMCATRRGGHQGGRRPPGGPTAPRARVLRRGHEGSACTGFSASYVQPPPALFQLHSREVQGTDQAKRSGR